VTEEHPTEDSAIGDSNLQVDLSIYEPLSVALERPTVTKGRSFYLC
jgi:hypothetical protein